MPWLASLHDESRNAERHQVDANATLRVTEQQPVDVLIANLSARGCLFFCQERLDPGAAVSIGIAGIGRLQSRIVRAEGTRYGAEFATPLADATIAAALATTSDVVIPFPLWASTTAVSADDPPQGRKLPGAARISLVSTLVAVSWIALIAALKLLL